jgi:hypothetical protein
MRQVIVLLLAAVLVVAMPLSVASAKSGGSGNANKVTICHKPNGARPVTITIAKAAWKAHQKHGDTLGACSGPTPKPAAPKVCTFSAATSAYYSGASAATALYATGPLRFSWAIATGAVKVPGGYWNEVLVSAPSVTYYNNVTAGSVSTAGAVSLSFARTVPDASSFAFAGSLSAMKGASTLSGTMAGSWFTASGTVSCNGETAAPTTCTFDAATSAYHSGANASAPLFATGPIRFAWTYATGVVTVPGGYWNEVLVSAPSLTYYNNVTSGSVSAGGAVSLAFTRTVPDSSAFSFSGALAPNALAGARTLSGFISGYYFTAAGTVACGS